MTKRTFSLQFSAGILDYLSLLPKASREGPPAANENNSTADGNSIVVRSGNCELAQLRTAFRSGGSASSLGQNKELVLPWS